MNIDYLGIASYTERDLVNMMYSGNIDNIKHALVDIDPTQLALFNAQAVEHGTDQLVPYSKLDIPIEEFDSMLQCNWKMPAEYVNLDITTWVMEKAPPVNAQRAEYELAEFSRRNMLPLLRWLKYFVDTCRSNNIVWGVGRGSSVSSYVLFLIGVHRIDSVKYSLDFHEFLR